VNNLATPKKEYGPGVIEGPVHKGSFIVPEDMVLIPLADGEDILVPKEEFEKIGLQGAIEKYAACFVHERIKQREGPIQ